MLYVGNKRLLCGVRRRQNDLFYRLWGPWRRLRMFEFKRMCSGRSDARKNKVDEF